MRDILTYNSGFTVNLCYAVYRTPIYPRPRRKYRPIKTRHNDPYKRCFISSWKERPTPKQVGLRDRVNYFLLNSGIKKQ